MKKSFASVLCGLLALCLLAGCGDGTSRPKAKKEVTRPEVESSEMQFQAPSPGDPIAIFDTSLGEVRAVLYPQLAPMAVENFTGLANQGYYNGLSFHRVLYGFVVQGGDATGTGTGGASIWKDKPFPNEISPKLRHYPGALCMAHSSDAEVSNLSQFYFVQALPEKLDKTLKKQLQEAATPEQVLAAYDAAGGLAYLDYTDTVFGQVYQGLEIVDAIALVDTDEAGKPLEDVLINSVSIATYEG